MLGSGRYGGKGPGCPGGVRKGEVTGLGRGRRGIEPRCLGGIEENSERVPPFQLSICRCRVYNIHYQIDFTIFLWHHHLLKKLEL